jgi:hypothetical protein
MSAAAGAAKSETPTQSAAGTFIPILTPSQLEPDTAERQPPHLL